jgi:dTDP-4-dehydrorhamnose reductase
LAQKGNAEVPKYIAGYFKKQNCLLIHLSTDYLFDGRGGPYAEEATPDPINFYGETKLRGEESIVNSGCEYIIVRTNQIYGNLPDGPSRLIRWVLKGKNERIRAAQDQYNNSTWAGNLADCIIELLKGAFRGVINIGGPDYLSRYDFAVKGAGVFGFENGNIIKGLMGDLELAASRPLKAGLTIAKMREILRTAPVSVLDGLKKVRDGAF